MGRSNRIRRSYNDFLDSIAVYNAHLNINLDAEKEGGIITVKFNNKPVYKVTSVGKAYLVLDAFLLGLSLGGSK